MVYFSSLCQQSQLLSNDDSIHLRRRDENLNRQIEFALEYHPETFAPVTMLFINCKIEGHPVKAFVDSGAQTTIMSEACAIRCGLANKLDRRHGGVAMGVGQQNIVGRIYTSSIEIEGVDLDVCLNPFYHLCLSLSSVYTCCLRHHLHITTRCAPLETVSHQSR